MAASVSAVVEPVHRLREIGVGRLVAGYQLSHQGDRSVKIESEQP